MAVDILTTLGVTPIAACAARSYRSTSADVVLPSTVTDVGFAAEPNLELLVALRPDIFVAGWPIHNVQIERIAPVLSLGLYSGQPDAYRAVQDAL